MDNSEARQRLLDAAEGLFANKGYSTVTLRDIAAEVGIRHTSIYHHAPGGKEQLFVEVVERNFNRHYEGLVQALAQAEPGLRAEVRAVGEWLMSQPPMDMVRMVYSDMPAIKPADAERLSMLAYESMILPLAHILEAAYERGEVDYHDFPLVAGGLIGMLESLHAAPELSGDKTHLEMAYYLIDVMLKGLYKRPE